MIRRPPRSTRTDTLFPYTTLFRSYKITRFKNVRLQDIGFRSAREKPEKVKEFLTKRLKDALGERYAPVAFTPPYNPWDQRLCLVPRSEERRVGKEGVSMCRSRGSPYK